MIKDIPTAEDFIKSASRFLNSAWSTATSLAQDIMEWEEYDIELEDHEKDAYWQAARDELAVAHITAYTGVEHLLRSRIATVSPFLLIAGTPREWPSKCDERDVAFADFRTLDAQDLVRVHDTIASQRLPAPFVQEYENLRRQRNKLVHSHDASISPAVAHLLLSITRSVHHILGARRWISMRRNSLKSSPNYTLRTDGVSSAINRELTLAVQLLGAADCRAYLGIDKRRRMYYCPICVDDCSEAESDMGDIQEGVAQLDKADPKALYCISCDTRIVVERIACVVDKCKGDVMHNHNNEGLRCLTCLGWNDPLDSDDNEEAAPEEL